MVLAMSNILTRCAQLSQSAEQEAAEDRAKCNGAFFFSYSDSFCSAGVRGFGGLELFFFVCYLLP